MTLLPVRQIVLPLEMHRVQLPKLITWVLRTGSHGTEVLEGVAVVVAAVVVPPAVQVAATNNQVQKIRSQGSRPMPF